MEDDQQFCLRWNNHQSTLISVFDTLLENQTLVDCTLAAEGKFLKAHKVVLSACSPFFATLLQQQYDKHPIFILKDVKYQELRAMMDYMYRGEVNISQDQLAALLKAAESLQIKGLSDNRSGNTQKSEQHRGLNVPGSGNSGGKLSGYTLEQTQTKRPRVGPSMDTTDLSASREGSSSPSRRRRKVRRRSVENAMPDVHDNSSSSQMNQSTIQPQQQHQQSQQSAANLTGIGALTAATSSLPAPAPVLPTGSSGVLGATGSIVSTQGTTQQMTPSITKKTESVKGISDAINTEAIQAVGGVVGAGDEQNLDNLKGEKSNHKQRSSAAGIVAKETTEMVIEPKSEYEEEGNEETVEDLTLDDEEMAMEDLDQNAGTSQAGEGSSQGYAPWQHDRSQDELLLAPQEAQQRDPQGFLPSFVDSTTFSNTPLSGISYSRREKESPLISNIVTNNDSNNDFHNSHQKINDITIERTDMIFSGNIAINSRYHIDNSEENFECPQCFRTYRRHGTLRRHLRQECGKGKSMVCSVCGHRTKRADHLRQHVRKKHPEMVIRSAHGTFRHRLAILQQQQQQSHASPPSPPPPPPLSMSSPILPTYSEIPRQLIKESNVVNIMGVDIVDLDKEDDDDADDNIQSVANIVDLKNDKSNTKSKNTLSFSKVNSEGKAEDGRARERIRVINKI